MTLFKHMLIHITVWAVWITNAAVGVIPATSKWFVIITAVAGFISAAAAWEAQHWNTDGTPQEGAFKPTT